MTRVSVIIPTRSRPKQLARAVESAFAAGTDVEVVVVDDASTDDTADVCRKLKSITYIRLEQNVGVAGARNAGVVASSAEYISLLDDDDLRLPGSLDLQLSVLGGLQDAGLIYGQALFGGATDHLAHDRYPLSCLSGDVFWQLLSQNFIPSGSVVIRRSCLLNAGLFNSSLAGIDDWDMWIRIASLHPVGALDHPVMIWRRSSPHSTQISGNAVEMVAMSTRQFRQNWSKMPRVIKAPKTARRKLARKFSKNMASHLIWEAKRLYSAGQFRRGNQCILAAMRLHPGGVFGRALAELFRKLQTNGRVDLTRSLQ